MSFNHYYLESMTKFKQLEIEKQTREAWKFAHTKDEKEINYIVEPLKTAKKPVLVVPSSCCFEC